MRPAIGRHLVLSLGILLAACAPGAPSSTAERPTPAPAGSGQPKTLVIGITGAVQAIGMAGATTPIGGWMSTNELHSQGLITSDVHSRKPVGQLAERPPSLEDGTISLLQDGRMRVVHTLRSGVTWHDGAPFTSRDLIFSYQVNTDPGLPFISRNALQHVESAEAPDDRTFVLHFASPFYKADSIGLREFWPYPCHLLHEAYDRFGASKDVNQVLGEPYWSSAYVGLGPFQVTAIEPGESLTLKAYEDYYQGRPKVDTIQIRTFGDENALFSSVLAGAVDVFMDLAMSPELGHQLKLRWEAAGEGTVHDLLGYTRFLTPQWRPETQRELAILDTRVRAALYHALDRRAISEAVQAGRGELVATALLPTNHRNFEGTKDTLSQYSYAPDRAKSLLQESGWSLGSDGALRNATDGRRFWTSVWANARWVQETALIADYWRKMGLEVEEFLIPGSRARDQEFRRTYPGWYTSSRYDDGILAPIEEPPATAENRWAGNSSGYDSPEGRRLAHAYTASLRIEEQTRAMRAISDFVAAELPILVLYYEADHIGVRKGVKALEDLRGGAGSGAGYGLYTRNAHLWDIQ